MFLFLTLFFCILFLKPVYAWDTNIAHPNLTALAVDLYNQNYNPKITDEQKKWMMEGAIEEDMPLRWFNHFYDPVHNKGFKNLWNAAPIWATDSYNQADYALGDNSWNRALVDYHKNDQKQAFIELGHAIHLIEDMLVPAHTRDDSHPNGDSLEQFVKFHWDDIEPFLPDAKINNFSDLNSAFLSGANYSNNNFYSDDTIESGDYKIINITGNKKIKISSKPYIIYLASLDKNYNLYISDSGSDWNKKIQKSYSVDNGYVLLDYSQHLLPQAIGNAAGVIELFFNETKKDPPKVSLFKISPLGVVNKLAGDLVVGAENLIGNSIYNPAPMPSLAAESNANIYDANNINTSTNNANLKTSNVDINNTNTKANTNANNTNPKINNTNTNNTNTSTEKPPQILKDPSPQINVPQPTTTKNSSTTTIQYYNPNLNPYHENIFVFTTSTEITTATTSTIDIPTSTPPVVTPTTTPTTTPENPTSTPPTPEIDTTAPTIPQITINNLSGFNSVELKINLSATDNQPGEIYFDLDYALAPATTTADFVWENFVTNTTTTNFSFFGVRNQTYYFRARAHDAAQNYSAWSSVDPDNMISATIGRSLAVVFNEIDWPGWGTSGDNNTGQWLELKNNTNAEVDLTNWKILKDDIPFTGTVVNSKIAANGYYLIEATENAVGQLAADRFLSSGFLLKGNNLRLVNQSGEIVDEVNCSSTGWFAGNKEKLASMERISPYLNGDNPSNWRTAPGIRLTQVYSGGLFSFSSSPRITNWAPIVLNGNQSNSEVTLTAAAGPYILGDYIVPAGKKLTIEAGAVLKSMGTNSALRVYGNLIISGTSTNRVLITSGRDLSDGSPLFGSYSPSTTIAGDWYGIVAYGGANLDITNLDLRGAGGARYLGDGAGGFAYNGITGSGAIINIRDSVFKDNGKNTLNFDSCTSTIYNSVFDGGEIAVKIFNTNIDFNNLTLKNYTSGLGPFELRVGINNKMTWGNNIVFENNAMNRLYFSGIIVNSDRVLPALKYVVGALTINSSTLTLPAGTDLAFLSGAAFAVTDGGINAVGDSDNQINIGPIPGARAGFFNFKNSISHFKYANFGAASFIASSYYGDRASLIINSSTIDFINTSFNNPNGSDPLILSYSSHLSFVGCEFYSPTKYHDAWSSSKAIKAFNGGLILKNSSFSNFNYGFLVNPDYTYFNPFVLADLTFNNVDTRFYSNVPYPISIGDSDSVSLAPESISMSANLGDVVDMGDSLGENLDLNITTSTIIDDINTTSTTVITDSGDSESAIITQSVPLGE